MTKHFTSWLDATQRDIAQLISRAREIKSGAQANQFPEKRMGLLFFNSSLRTRVSFEAALHSLGAAAITLDVKEALWKLEFGDNVVMSATEAEHIREAAPVLSRYVDLIGVRAFAELKNLEQDAADKLLTSFRTHSEVPVVSLESAMEHPCQGLADLLTLRELVPEPKGKHFVLSWAPHIKPLPMAVPHSALLAGAMSGMHVTVSHPAGYELHPKYLAFAEELATANGTRINFSNDQRALQDADVIYVKSWGAQTLYGKAVAQERSFEEHRSWMLGKQMGKNCIALLHCLPVRRNVVASDHALDTFKDTILRQAENRLHAQTALLEYLFGGLEHGV